MQNAVGLTLVAKAMKFGLRAEIQSPTDLLYIICCVVNINNKVHSLLLLVCAAIVLFSSLKTTYTQSMQTLHTCHYRKITLHEGSQPQQVSKQHTRNKQEVSKAVAVPECGDMLRGS